MISEAKIDEACDVASILERAYLEFRRFYTETAFQQTIKDHDGILQRMKEGPVYIARSGGQKVGTISIAFKKEGGYVRGLAVLPEARGLGVASQLIEHIVLVAYNNRMSCLFLYTTEFLLTAIRL